MVPSAGRSSRLEPERSRELRGWGAAQDSAPLPGPESNSVDPDGGGHAAPAASEGGSICPRPEGCGYCSTGETEARGLSLCGCGGWAAPGRGPGAHPRGSGTAGGGTSLTPPQPGPAPAPSPGPQPCPAPQPCLEGAGPGRGLPLPPFQPLPATPPPAGALSQSHPAAPWSPYPPGLDPTQRPPPGRCPVWGGRGLEKPHVSAEGGHGLPRPGFRSPPSFTAVCTRRRLHLRCLSFLPGQREQDAASMGHNLAGGRGRPRYLSH